jgi:hypothetical protein
MKDIRQTCHPSTFTLIQQLDYYIFLARRHKLHLRHTIHHIDVVHAFHTALVALMYAVDADLARKSVRLWCATQFTLFRYAYCLSMAHPCLLRHGRFIPDFFLSQSSSTFNLLISLYSKAGSRCAATGLGLRFPSKNVLA